MNKEEKELFEKKKDPTSGQFVNPIDDPNKTFSQAKAKVLQNVDTFFYIGTEVCEIFVRYRIYSIIIGNGIESIEKRTTRVLF